MSDTTIRINKETRKKLSKLKIEKEEKTLDSMINKLLEVFENVSTNKKSS